MTELGSINLVVEDMSAAERFYAGVLGLRVDEERSNRPSFVLLRAANCMVILQQGTQGEAGYAIELGFSVDDVEDMRRKLGDRARVQQMGWGEAIETADPAGTRLNLFRLGRE